MSADHRTVADNEEPFCQDFRFNETAFEMFFREYFGPLCAYCQYKFGVDLEQAKDTVHASFLKLWETRDRISDETTAKAYLYKIVGNLSLDLIKHKKVRDKKEKQLLRQELSANQFSGFENADLKQLGADIDKAVSELPEQMRKVFELCRYDGLKYSEVASQLSISVKTVETHMSRALIKLRQKLSDYLVLFCIVLYLISGI